MEGRVSCKTERETERDSFLFTFQTVELSLWVLSFRGTASLVEQAVREQTRDNGSYGTYMDNFYTGY